MAIFGYRIKIFLFARAARDRDHETPPMEGSVMKRTTKFLPSIAAMACLLSLTGCGSPAANGSNPSAQENGEQSQDFSNTGYVLREDLALRPLGDNAPPAFVLSAGSELAVLEMKADAKLGTIVHLGIDAQENGRVPSDVWVSQTEVPNEALEPYAPADYDSEENQDGDFSAQKAMTYCYRYVKQYLLQTGQVRIYLPGESAWQAAGILPKQGFHRTGHSPASAKNGEVCVYSGGPAGHGHIEVKRNGRWWYGYGFKPNPISGRRFIACFAK